MIGEKLDFLMLQRRNRAVSLNMICTQLSSWKLVSLVQMDASSLNYWLTKFIQEVAKPSKERYQAKTLYQILCGKIGRFIKEKFLILSMLRTKVVLLYVTLFIIHFDTLILLHWMLAINKLALKCITTLRLNSVFHLHTLVFLYEYAIKKHFTQHTGLKSFQSTCGFQLVFHSVAQFIHLTRMRRSGWATTSWIFNEFGNYCLSFSINSVRPLTKRVLIWRWFVSAFSRVFSSSLIAFV